MKFCCEKFNFFYSGDKNKGLNIRIIKYSKNFIERGGLDFDKGYFITEGYTGMIDECNKKMVIQHCPFCGSELKRRYKSDDYVQEIMDV